MSCTPFSFNLTLIAALLFIFFNANSVPSQFTKNCVFTDKNNQNWWLNLSDVMEKTIIGQSPCNHTNSTFYYSPCSNNLQCNSKSNGSMAIANNTNSCLSLATWSSTMSDFPIFDIKQQSWSFYYNNQLCTNSNFNASYPIHFNVQWICNSSETIKNWNVVWSECNNNSSECDYLMVIESPYACLGCIFQQNDEILNLTDLQGINITYSDSSGIVWSYTPCWNFTNTDAMIIGYLDQNRLLNKFATWNGDFDIKIDEIKTKNTSIRYWQFTFYNYGICNAENQRKNYYNAIVSWICNDKIDQYEVTQIIWDPMIECQVYINIETKYACTANLTITA